MKELSIEEKARRYDEAIGKLRGMMPYWENLSYNGKTFLQDLVYVFPELKESEDEKWIPKEIAKYLKEKGGFRSCWLAWLEKQGEQKPADKVEPKFKVGDIVIHKELGGDYIHNPHKIIQVDILDKKYRLEGGLVAHFSEQDDYELVEQKPTEWSEEDEQTLNLIIARLHSHPNVEAEEYGKDYHWLQFLKDRVQPQPNQEWSGGDEVMLDEIIDFFENGTVKLQHDLSLYASWLKSLKDRCTWNPSKGQMKALNTCIMQGEISYVGQGTELHSLYNDLKKLTE